MVKLPHASQNRGHCPLGPTQPHAGGLNPIPHSSGTRDSLELASSWPVWVPNPLTRTAAHHVTLPAGHSPPLRGRQQLKKQGCELRARPPHTHPPAIPKHSSCAFSKQLNLDSSLAPWNEHAGGSAWGNLLPQNKNRDLCSRVPRRAACTEGPLGSCTSPALSHSPS